MNGHLIGMPYAGNSTFRQYMTAKYVRGLNMAGAEVRILPQTLDDEVLEQYVAECEGFLFPGGPDLDPAMYGEVKDARCGDQDTARDQFEYALMRKVMETDKPVLCICRGLQLLNVVRGGTLIQDITDQEDCQHSDFEHRGSASHPIYIRNDDNLLRKALGVDQCNVNSMHHQAIDRVGNGLDVIAKSPEGYPEAIQLKQKRFCLGVQWHPEHMADHDERQENVFCAFVAACGENGNGPLAEETDVQRQARKDYTRALIDSTRMG